MNDDGRRDNDGLGRPTLEIDNSGPSNISNDKQSTIKYDGTGIPLGISRVCPKRRRLDDGNEDSDERTTENIQGVAKSIQKDNSEIVTRILGELRCSTGTYLSDVVKCRDNDEASRFAKAVSEGAKLFKRGIVLISKDKDHVHVIHDCAYSNKSCRCAFFKKAEIMFGHRRRDRSSRGRPLCNSIRSTDLENILKYFSLSPRETVYLKSGGLVERLSSEDSSLEEQGPSGTDGLADEGEESKKEDRVQLFGEQPRNLECPERSRRGREALARKKECYVAGKQICRMELMLLTIQNNPTSPVEGILNHPIWLLNKQLRFLNGSDNEVKAVFNNWTKQLCRWNIEDYNVMYSDSACKPIFSAGCENVDSYYYDVEKSIDVLDELIKFQFGHDDEYCFKFVTDLFNVLERKLPKCNTLLIKSPSSAGKNYMFDAIKDYYINVGHVSKLNKWNSFPLQDADGRRLIFMNEPNYTDDWIDTLKMLLGGDATNVSVKYKAECPLYRTPIIILTNDLLTIMSNPSFKDRMKVYHWSTAPYLKDYTKKPHPLATYGLFKRYNLVQ